MSTHNQNYRLETLTVAVVDDQDPIRKAVKRVLQKMGVETIIECFDGSEILKTSEDMPVDLILLDLYMRKTTGFQVLEEIRGRAFGSDIPVIVLTGEASREDIVKAADVGADDYLLKPFQTGDLEKKIHLVLSKFFSPAPFLASLRKGDREIVKKRYSEALEHFEEALRQEPSSIRGRHSRAYALSQLNRDPEAIESLKICIRDNPSYYRAYASLAEIYLKLGQEYDAQEMIKLELEYNPKNLARQVQLAKMLLKQQSFDGAMAHFRQALKVDPKFKGALLGMGHALARSNNLEKGIYYFKRVRRYHATATAALDAIVDYCEKTNDRKRAELIIKDERNGNPDRIDTYVVLTNLLMRDDRATEARTIIDEAAIRAPEDLEVIRTKGEVCLKTEDFIAAATCFEKVVKEQPSIEAYLGYAEALFALTRLAECASVLQKLVVHAPTNSKVWVLFGLVYKATEQWLKANIMFRKAVGLGASAEVCHNEIKICIDKTMARRRRGRSRIAS